MRRLSGPGLDARSVASLIREMKLGDRARFLLTHETRAEFGVEPESLSLAFYAEQQRLRTHHLPAFRFRAGADLLPLALARGRDVRLETPVSAISWSRTGVTVTAGGDELDADAAVVAVPVPVLGTIEFDPEPSPALQAATEELRYGHGVKTILQYEKGFRARGSVASDLSFQAASIAENRVATAYTTGRNGLLYGTISKHTRPLLVADELGEVYPGSRGLYLLGDSYAWHTDGWSLGTAVAYSPGQVTRFQEVIRSTVRARPIRRRAHGCARGDDGGRDPLRTTCGSRDRPCLVVTRSGDSNPKAQSDDKSVRTAAKRSVFVAVFVAALASAAVAAGSNGKPAIRFLSVGRAYQGKPLTVSVAAKGSASCSLAVRYADGSTQANLRSSSPAKGTATWMWTLPQITAPGAARLTVRCGSAQARRMVTVVGTLIPAKIVVAKSGYSIRSRPLSGTRSATGSSSRTCPRTSPPNR